MPLKNHQYQELMRKYDDYQLHGRYIQQQRREEVFAKIPELLLIEDKIAQLSVEQGKKLLDGDTLALTVLRNELVSLAASKDRLLKDNGFPADYLHPVYHCPDCRDTGFIENKKCHCFIQATIDLLYTQSNIREKLEAENFCTFEIDYYSKTLKDPTSGISAYENAQRALNTAKAFISDFATQYQNLLIFGSTGVGKTFLTNCIAKELLESSYSVLYFSASQLFDALADSAFSKDKQTDSWADEDIYDCDLLIIDDLGTELTNSFVSSSLFVCLNERHLRKKPTIISTNLSLEAIRDTYSERIFSRLSMNYIFIKLFGDDIRISKKLKNTWRS